MHLLSPEVSLCALGGAGCSFASKGPEGDWNLPCSFSSHSSEPNSIFPSFFHILSISLRTERLAVVSWLLLRLSAADSHCRQKQTCVCCLCAGQLLEPSGTFPALLREPGPAPHALSTLTGDAGGFELHSEICCSAFQRY